LHGGAIKNAPVQLVANKLGITWINILPRDSAARYEIAGTGRAGSMSRMIKDYVEIADHGSLDSLIARLEAVRDSLPAGGQTEVRMRGDDVFGRHLCIAFLRPLTAEEAACEGRYAGSAKTRLRRAA
jgi:hypothetical protein